jgi:hypothetical protein
VASVRYGHFRLRLEVEQVELARSGHAQRVKGRRTPDPRAFVCGDRPRARQGPPPMEGVSDRESAVLQIRAVVETVLVVGNESAL